jgi:hypothetical protein
MDIYVYMYLYMYIHYKYPFICCISRANSDVFCVFNIHYISLDLMHISSQC